MQDLTGKVAVVTGGASGIGRGMARRFVGEGMHVVLGDIELPALEATVRELSDAGGDVLGVACDVTDPEQMDALAAAAVDAYGGVHVFCNNAGVGGGGLSWEIPLETWEWVLGVNLLGVIHGIHSFVPRLLEQDEAHIVNTASMAGLVAAPFMGPYNASKHAVVGISETLYHELGMMGGKVKVSVLCAGWVDTAIADSERNRPAHLAVETDPAAEGLLAPLKELLAAGMSPDEVAGQVIDAIHGERFWILTHEGEEWTEAVNRRVRSLSERTNPVMTLFA